MATTRKLTESILTGLLTYIPCYRGICTDLDTCLTAGIWQVQYSTTANVPEGMYAYGILLVLKTASFIAQVCFPHSVKEGEKYSWWLRMWTEGRFNIWRHFTAD